jgi:hypothetical protein
MKKEHILILLLVCFTIAGITIYLFLKSRNESFALTKEETKDCETQCQLTKQAYVLGGDDAYKACMETCKMQFKEDAKNSLSFL